MRTPTRPRPPLATAVLAIALGGCQPAALGPTGLVEAAFEAPTAQALRSPADALRVGGTVDDALRHPGLAADARGRAFAAVWEERQGERTRAFVRVLDARNRTLYPFNEPRDARPLAPSTGAQTAPVVAADADTWVAAWADARTDAPGVYARRLDATGAFAGDAFRVAAGGTAPALSPPVAPGVLLAAWQGPDGVQAAFVNAQGAQAPLTVAGRGGFLGLFTAAPKQPLVAAGEGRALVAWAEDGAMKAATLDVAGALGPVLTLAPGTPAGVAYDPVAKRFVAAFERDGQVFARTLGADGTPGAEARLGEGTGAALAYDPSAQGFVAAWRSKGYVARQALSGALAPVGPTALLPSAGARAFALAYDPVRKVPLLACEERIFSLDRVTLLALE